VYSPTQSCGYFEFDNVKCISKDPTYLSFEHCLLRSANRTYKYLSIKGIAHKLPITRASVTVKLFKRENNNYVFDHFTFRVDACRFLQARVNPMAKFLFSILQDYININTTCPINEDLILEKLPVHHVYPLVKYIIPDGQYYIIIAWLLENSKRNEITVYFSKYS
ncbi:hypothetical protein KR222_004746, partial [Zaprionus bogoriensis]